MARIAAPTGFTGTGVGGLEFVDGVADTDNEAIIDYCRRAGYVVDGAGGRRDLSEPYVPVVNTGTGHLVLPAPANAAEADAFEELQAARVALRELEDRVIKANDVTPTEAAEAKARVELAELRVEALLKRTSEEALAEQKAAYDARVAEATEERRRHHEQHMADVRASEERARASGLRQAVSDDLGRNGGGGVRFTDET